ncbi:hypothetical protein UCRPA7_3421 [Phaeoacremonium minimum UCRPA7]|uniref:Uncharacterized protein n=1 Tax=Phaeoacremonium minimum (strain UCR-PA7) TaxID=1286976 RepID=R8BP08_PHAM7|nr:hypothetical protein UCRPA7_3421 [Phaeoacremonium minimum UCRPA7]EOO01081.1 hypothetical protein UCRPA7_3421 [Phaeoacremonium minimum UCRPA7]
MGCIVSGLVLANADNGEYDEAEAHLKGLFKIMDIYEGSGQLLSGWILGRVTIMPLAMIFATAWNLPYGGSNKDDSKQLPPSASHKSLWAEAAYFYELFAIEFLRDQMTGSRPKAGGEAERLDVIILKWLYNQRLMHPYGVQLEDASDASRKLTTQNQDWLDDWIWVWRNSGKPMTAWPWQQILKKIAWVETEEGFEFIKTVYHEAAKEQK